MYRFKLLNPLVWLVGALALLAACSADSETHDSPDVPLGTLDLIISDPTARAVKLPGDPGTGHAEDVAHWNRLVLLMVYDATTPPDDGKPFRKHTLTKEEFTALPSSQDGYRHFSLKMPLGKVYLYGLTYTAEAQGAAELTQAMEAISKKSAFQDIQTAIERLTLTNDYAATLEPNKPNPNRVPMFLSVASGYYKDTENGRPAPLTITTNRNPGDALPSMRLSRLAAKLDVQWDAADAFAPGKEVKAVKVKSIEVMPGNENATIPQGKGKGHGRIFPKLQTSESGILMGRLTFANTNPISQRNGRMDIYLFPDGVSLPKLTYTISGTKNDGKPVNGTHSEVLKEKGAAPSPLLPGAWYKVNTHIKGLDALTNIDTQTTH